MTLNALLEIIISLVALFWLLSIACSFAVEAANSLFLNIRAKALERFVCEMVLGNNKIPQLRYFLMFWRRSNLEPTRGAEHRLAGSLADPLGLFSHGLVRSLRKPQNIPGGVSSPPSYIPAALFGQTLLDRLLSLSWALQADAAETSRRLDSLALTARWRQRLDDSKIGVGAAAPLINAVVHLLKEIQDSSIVTARADLQSLIVELNDATNTRILRGLPAVPALPRLTSVDSTPIGLRNLLVQIIDAADQGIAALSESRFIGASKPVLSLVNPEALWMLAIRKAGESIVHTPVMMDTVRDLLERAPLPMSLREALRPIVAEADFDPDKLRKGVEVWYDSVMERATGWFKRYTTVMLGVLGLGAAMLLNVNTISVAQDLAKDPALRHAGVAFAEFVVREKGRPQIAQQYAFYEQSQRANWSRRIADLDAKEQSGHCADHGDCEIANLFEHMSPLLLNSGQYYGPSKLLFIASKGSPSQAGASGVALRSSLCLASLQHVAFIARDMGGTPPDPKEQMKTWSTQPVCQWVVKDFGTDRDKDMSAADDTRRFWQDPNIVWHPALGKALRAAYETAASAPPLDQKRMAEDIEALKEAFGSALSDSKQIHDQAHNYLDRIPSFGRQGTNSGMGWLFPGGFWFDLLGWMITAVMVSFGASFWFDLLSNLVDRRATGPRPDGQTT